MICIGIDPGKQTGIAIWSKTRKKFESIETVRIHQAMIIVQQQMELHGSSNLRVYVENPNTWIGWERRKKSDSKKMGAGSIKRDYSIWEDYLDDIGVEMIGTKLQGTLKKLRYEEFAQITGIKKRTTEHSRDAAMLVFDR